MSPRTAIAVHPRLLAEAIGSLLVREGHQVTYWEAPAGVADPTPHATADFDVALVSGTTPVGLRASTVILLPDTATCSGQGAVITAGGERPVHISGLEGLLDLVRDSVAAGRPRPVARR